MFCNLPLDMIIHILSFDNKIKYKNGKFINQIDKKDERYNLLKKLPKIQTRMIFDKPFYYFKNLGNNYQVKISKINTDDLYPHLNDSQQYYQLSFSKCRKIDEKTSIMMYNYIIR